jgi:hypothetical protein
MNALKLAHPNSDELAAFATGQVPEEVATAISLHLADCAACRTAFDMLPEDTLLVLLRQPPRLADSPANPPAEEKAGLDKGAAAATGPSPTSPVPLEIPPELAGHPRYSVLEPLGVGGMGAVYKAKHRLMERHVALKVINPGLMKRPATVERFRREVKAAARLAHPHIVTAYDADQAGDAHFLVMEYVEGISLAQRVQHQGPLPVSEACAYARQTALGLQHACEQGMVHRDIKPHNLMVTPAGQVKILDFGLARFVRETALDAKEAGGPVSEAVAADAGGCPASLTDAGVLMGTADFIAPEQADDPRQADIQADIYSLGCTLYYLLAGQVPFPGGTALEKLAAHRERTPAPLTKLRGDVPAKVARVVERMMAKDPVERYATPAEVAEALKPFAEKASPTRRGVRRRVAARCLAAVLVAGAVIACGVIYVRTDRGEFIIETDDRNIAVMLHEKGVKIHDRAANREYQLKVGANDVRTGKYEIDVAELPDGVHFKTTTFELRRGGKVTASATFKPKEDGRYLLDEGLRWFPADATFFGARDLRAFPDLSVQQMLVLTQMVDRIWPRDQDRIWKLVSIVGRIDRVAFAYAADEQQPAKSRIFVRVTGSINHQRLVDWFRNDWRGVTIKEEKGTLGEPITLIGSTQAAPPAFAVVGKTDLILAGYQGLDENHLEVVRQVLESRAGRGTSLPGAYAKALEKMPADAWALIMGRPPEAMRRLVPLPVPPRTAALFMRGNEEIDLSFHGLFATAEDAKTFIGTVNGLKQQAIAFLEHPPVKIAPQATELLAKTVNRVEMEASGDNVNGAIHIPSAAVTALVETLRDLPLSLFNKLFGLAAPKDQGQRPNKNTVIKTFGPSDKPLTQQGITTDQNGWRLEAKGDRTVRLFEVSNPAVEDCKLTYRAHMKTANLQGRAYLEMWCRFPETGEFFSRGLFQPVSGTTGWAFYEIPFFLKKGQRPDLIKLNVVLEGTGTIWIKEVELRQNDLPALTGSPGQAGKLLKAFRPPDKPLTKDRVIAEDDGWRIEAGEKEVRTLHLFEVPNPDADRCLLFYRLDMKTQLAGSAYQEMWCRFPGLGEFFSKGLNVDSMAFGNTDWTTYVIPFRLEKGQKPDLVKLDLVVHGIGKVRIKNVELRKVPLGP